MGRAQFLPVLVTGGGHRIDLALAWHFISQEQPVIISYRIRYPTTNGPIRTDTRYIQADFSTSDDMMAFASGVLRNTHGLRAILHNASVWMTERPGAPLTGVLACMMQIHVDTPYLLNHTLERLLHGHRHAANGTIHFTDYVVKCGSDKHIVYVANRATLDNMTRSFARELAPEMKMNSIAPSLILFNEYDDAKYRQQTLSKSPMKTASGEKEVIDLVNYLLTSCFVTRHGLPFDGGRHPR